MMNQPIKELVDLENIKNQISMSEGEVKRLRGLRVSEEYAIGELVKAKKYHEDEIERLKKTVQEAHAKVVALNNQLQEASETIDKAASVKEELRLERDKLTAERESHRKDVADSHDLLAERAAHIIEREAEAERRHNDLSEREAQVKEKESKIKTVLAQLSEVE